MRERLAIDIFLPPGPLADEELLRGRVLSAICVTGLFGGAVMLVARILEVGLRPSVFIGMFGVAFVGLLPLALRWGAGTRRVGTVLTFVMMLLLWAMMTTGGLLQSPAASLLPVLPLLGTFLVGPVHGGLVTGLTTSFLCVVALFGTHWDLPPIPLAALAGECVSLGVVTLVAVASHLFQAEMLQQLQIGLSTIRRANQDLQQSKKEAMAADRAKGAFLANMSHEIRTPMNAIIGYTDMIKEEIEETGEMEEWLEDIGRIHAAGHNLLGIINDILDFSKVEAGTLELESIPMSIDKVVDDVIDMVRLKAQDRGVEVLKDVQVEVDVLGDPTRLRQLLLNLSSNAVKFTHQGHVRISLVTVGMDDRTVTLRGEVEDTGMGIPDEAMESLFAPFTQVDASVTRLHGGTGLGLAICDRLCRLMGGQIGVKSEVGKGTTFWFMLDLDRDRSEDSLLSLEDATV